MKIEFVSKEHEDLFFTLLKKDNPKRGDVERFQLFYTLSCPYLKDTILNIYDFDNHQLAEGWQEFVEDCDTHTMQMLKRTIHLYNGMNDDVPTGSLLTWADDNNKLVLLNQFAIISSLYEF